MIEMFLPMPCSFLRICSRKPWPKARSSRTVTVPHAIEATVRTARFFFRRAVCKKRWKTTEKEEIFTGWTTVSSLQLHCDHGIEPRSFARREIAGEEANSAEDGRRQKRDGRRKLRPADDLAETFRRYRGADQEREEQARGAADTGEQQGFEPELPENELLFGPKRHLDADFARPFVDDDVNDVGHADSPDDERQRAEQAEEQVEGEKKDVEKVEVLGRV